MKETKKRFMFIFDNMEELISEANSQQKNMFIEFLNDDVFSDMSGDQIKVICTSFEPLRKENSLLN